MTVSDKFLDYAKKEVADAVIDLTSTTERDKAEKMADEIVAKIDWNNKSLMHKGLIWITERYLEVNNVIR